MLLSEHLKFVYDFLHFSPFLAPTVFNQNSAESGVAPAPHSTPIPTKR